MDKMEEHTYFISHLMGKIEHLPTDQGRFSKTVVDAIGQYIEIR
jgi:hypothetical protein